MSAAEELREAAEVVRSEWQAETRGPFKEAARIHLAVADWLDSTARFILRGELPRSRDLHAIRVARAYLGADR